MARVVIVGVGSLGSHLALLIRNFPIPITVIDHDRIEKKNVLSQFHTNMGVGKNKAQALQQALQGLFGLRIEAVPHKLTADNAATLLKGATVVVDCTDNAEARRLIQATAVAAGIPCLHGALAADGAFGRVAWAAQFAIDAGGEGQATCEDGLHLPFILGVAAQLALALQRFLADGSQRGVHVHPGGVIAV